MGGTGSGRKPSFKTLFILSLIDDQVFNTTLISDIENKKVAYEEIISRLFKKRKQSRDRCGEIEGLKER